MQGGFKLSVMQLQPGISASPNCRQVPFYLLYSSTVLYKLKRNHVTLFFILSGLVALLFNFHSLT